MKLSHSVSGPVRRFSYWIANGTVGYPLLEGIDYYLFNPHFSLKKEYDFFVSKCTITSTYLSQCNN